MKKEERVTRRAALQVGVATALGAAAGGVGGYLLRQGEPTRPVSTTERGTSTVSRPTEKITIGSIGTGVYLYTVMRLLTVENMTKMGYNAEYAPLGSRGGVDAFLARQIPFLISSPNTIMPAIEQGENAVLVGPDTPAGFVLVSSADVKSLSDLEGKIVGVTRPGALDDTIPRFLLNRSGIDANKISWTAIESENERSVALLAGRIQATVLNADESFRLLSESNKLHILTRVSDILPGLFPDIRHVFVHADWADANSQVVEDLLRAKIAAEVWAVNNRDELVKLAASKILEKTDTQSIEFYGKVYDFYRSNGWLPFLSVDLESVKLQLSMAKEAGTIKGTVPVEQFYEPKYLTEVISDLLK